MAESVLTTKGEAGLRQELLLEQRRLAKLWDAFKKQEDEYRALQQERDDLWNRVQELEKATANVGDPTQTQARLDHLEKENARLRADVGDIGQRLEDNRAAFHQEQERLAKLFKVYEDTQSQLEAATKEVERLKTAAAVPAVRIKAKAPAKRRAKKTGLTAKQRAQRRYAGKMAVIRKRAKKASGGKGRIKNRTAAKKLRTKLGIKAS